MRLVVIVLLAAVMSGCPSLVGPGDDAGDDLATEAGVDGGVDIDRVCAALMAREQMCNAPQCQLDDLQRACPSFASHLRPEAAAALIDCASTTPACPSDAGMVSPLDQCFATATASLTPTSAQLEAATSICMACPGAGGDPMATEASCEAMFFQRMDAGDNSAGSLLLLFDDATARTAGQNCASAAADAGSFCGVSVALCTVVAVGIPLGSSCGDGG